MMDIEVEMSVAMKKISGMIFIRNEETTVEIEYFDKR
jgi:hypothetical protein